MGYRVAGGPINVEEVLKCIGEFKVRKAPGADLVQPEHVKYGGEIVATALCKLFNAVVSIGHIPSQWKKGLWEVTNPNTPQIVTVLFLCFQHCRKYSKKYCIEGSMQKLLRLTR